MNGIRKLSRLLLPVIVFLLLKPLLPGIVTWRLEDLEAGHGVALNMLNGGLWCGILPIAGCFFVARLAEKGEIRRAEVWHRRALVAYCAALLVICGLLASAAAEMARGESSFVFILEAQTAEAVKAYALTLAALTLALFMLGRLLGKKSSLWLTVGVSAGLFLGGRILSVYVCLAHWELNAGNVIACYIGMGISAAGCFAAPFMLIPLKGFASSFQK